MFRDGRDGGPGPVTRVLAVNGRIAGVRSVDVRPLVSGTLVEVLVAEGDMVTAGQTLMQLDTAAQQAIVRQALAGLDAALVAQEDAVATLARTQALGANVARVVLESAERAEQTAAQEVARMTALLDQAQIQLEKFTIRAPMAGTVLVLNAEPGQSVDPATGLADDCRSWPAGRRDGCGRILCHADPHRPARGTAIVGRDVGARRACQLRLAAGG